MTKTTLNAKEMWKSLEEGSFPKYYLDNHRTALQRAIDAHDPNVRVERKKELEDGDYQLFDSCGWEPFCLQKAKVISDDGRVLAVRQYNHKEGEQGYWTEVDISALQKNLEAMPSAPKGISYEKPEKRFAGGYYTSRYPTEAHFERKMLEQEREDQQREGLTIRHGVRI